MSSQKGNVSRSRQQKHQNTFAYRNDKYGATVQVKKAKSKIHDGLCQRCKEVLEWRVKYNKYKTLTQPKKCVKCFQKSVKDAYHIICKPCALQLDVCCKCGKKEDIVIPVNSHLDKTENEEDEEQKKKGCRRGKKDADDMDSDDDYDVDDCSDFGDDDEDDVEDFHSDSGPKKTQKNKSAALPDVSQVNIKA
ncbi:uncharacterized protein C9orf85 homolog [Scomber scombrus]|uniref:Uncharacterized protein C9orf85 homolog n=1 Tax=Scomber scombrus TaxID=13677 RepID=A0AAV1MU98_SCOSC|nr:uncharacterized protein C9orf85 homolog [Scomber scombrus]